MIVRPTRRPAILCFSGILTLCVIQAESLASATDPNNAALVYYQALLVRPEPNNYDEINKTLAGASPSGQLREYLRGRDCRNTITLVETASHIHHCDWGLLPSQPRGLIGQTLPELRHLGLLLEVEARALASQGKWEAALEMCMILRRFASHIGDNTYLMYSVANTLDQRALACIRDLLQAMPSDTQMLTWLRDQFRATEVGRWHPMRALESWRDMEEGFWRRWAGTEAFNRDDFLKERGFERIEDEAAKKKIMDMTDDQMIVLILLQARMSGGAKNISVPPHLLARAREACDKFLNSALEAIESGGSYGETYTKLEQMVASLDDRIHDGDPIALLSDAPKSVATYYRLHNGDAASLNATYATIGLLLIKTSTGQFPDVLPNGLPKDPFSGQDFQYRRTDEGFVLGFGTGYTAYPNGRQLEFKVR